MPRTISDIIPPSRRRSMDTMNPDSNVMPEDSFTPPNQSMPPMPPTPPRVKIRTGRSFPYGTALIALIVIALSAGALYAFADAKVEVTPASQQATVSGDFTATAGTGDLPFSVVTVTKTANALVPAESTATVNNSAQGTILVSNTQTKAQALITNTRFQTPSGVVFRIHAPITIPAATASGPGTLSVTVYADQPGQASNIGPSTFTLPGLTNSAAYEEVTAKSAGPMVGGFAGTQGTISQTTDDTQHNTLQAALATSLTNALTGQIPTGDVLIPGASMTNYQTLPDTATTTSTVQVSEQGTVTAVVFPETALAKAIAEKVVGTYSGEPVTLDTVSKLTLTPATTGDPTSAQTYNFSLAGSATVIWQVDTTKIAGAVAGKTRDSAQQILSGFPEVDRAVLILRPFWTSTFPQDPSHIQVTVTAPTAS